MSAAGVRRGGSTGSHGVGPRERIGQGRTWTDGHRVRRGLAPRLDSGLTRRAANGDYGGLRVRLGDGDVLAPGSTYDAASTATGPAVHPASASTAARVGVGVGDCTVHELAWRGTDLSTARGLASSCDVQPSRRRPRARNVHLARGRQTPPARWMIPSWPPVAAAPLPARQASVTFRSEYAERPDVGRAGGRSRHRRHQRRRPAGARGPREQRAADLAHVLHAADPGRRRSGRVPTRALDHRQRPRPGRRRDGRRARRPARHRRAERALRGP